MLSPVFAHTHAPAQPEDDHAHTMEGRNSALSRMLVILSAGFVVNILCSVLLCSAAASSSCVENCFNSKDKENEPAAVNITSCVQNCISNKTAENTKRRRNPIAGSNSDNDEGGLHPIHTFFVKTGETKADEMALQFTKYGKYNNYLAVNQLKSAFCLGHTVILKVSTDDTKYFSTTYVVWPKRPEVDWVADALRTKLEDVYFIHYESHTQPSLKLGNDSSQYKDLPMVLIHLFNGKGFNGNGSYTPGGGGQL